MREDDGGWYVRMAQRAAERVRREDVKLTRTLPADLRLPDGAEDTPRWWCRSCGLADAPKAGPFEPFAVCPRCESTQRWHGRVGDRDGTAVEPPDGQCRDCYQWRRDHGPAYSASWFWFRICPNGCECAHHADEVWLAAC